MTNLFRAAATLQTRLGTLGLILLAELTVISVWVDNGSLTAGGPWIEMLARWGASGARFAVALALFWIVFGQARAPVIFRDTEEFLASGIRAPWLTAHAVLLAVFCWFTHLLYNRPALEEAAALWALSGVGVVVSAALIFLPPAAWRLLGTRTADIWGFGLVAAGGAVALSASARSLWGPFSGATFQVSAWLLSWVAPVIHSDPGRRILGTDRFQVRIAPECSGFEGMALILVFGGAWLWFFRSEYRFPRALLLIPAALVAIWLLNAMRIASLIWLGHAGWEAVAAGGFHSQAGWIAFVLVSLGLCWASRRWRWVTADADRSVGPRPQTPSVGDWTAPWLLPLLAILGTGLVTRAASSNEFDLLYPLKVFAAGGAMWLFRNEYRRLKWRLSWAAPVAGVAAFALWMGLERLSPAPPNTAIRDGLAALGSPSAALWTAFRVVGASLTVPFAEELAFRGFLLRRLASPTFIRVDPRQFRALAWLGSSLAFGLLHGDRWLPGTLAGLIYAAAYARRASFGDAVAAHGITNALLAAWVLATGETQLW